MELSANRKYRLDEAFFETWSPTMAYVLGFWFADGYMRKEKSYRTLFVSNDFQILEDMRRALKSNAPIRKKRNDAAFELVFHSKELYEGLRHRGGLRCKSRTMAFPFVPQAYLRDFIRGYFDGDGSVFFVEYFRTKDGRRTRELRTNFTSGSEAFLFSLMENLNEEIDLPMKKLCPYNGGGSLKLGYGMKDSDALLRYMYYENFSIGLMRKADFVHQIPKYERHEIHH